MKIVNEQLQFPTAKLVPPNPSGYVMIAAETGSSLGLFPTGRAKTKGLIAQSRAMRDELKQLDTVQEVNVFKALLFPPGRGKLVRKRDVHIAKFDLVFLVETESVEAARALRKEPLYRQLVDMIEAQSRYTLEIAAANTRKIANVDHRRQGVFLFNYFYADEVSELLPVWEYTAGWFTDVTKLDNSTLFQPTEDSASHYGVINHCRWDKLSNILPYLIFRRTFRSYVLANFEANQIAAMPILYKLVL